MNAYSLIIALVVLPLASEANWWDKPLPPILAPQLENICNEVNCGKGKCEAAPGETFNFKCTCDAGWKRTPFRKDDDDDDDDADGLEFLPCVIPNCSLNYSCMPSAPVAPPLPNNESFSDTCYWTYCGEGTCNKNATSSLGHSCHCNPGYNNLLNISAFPCYNDCALGSDCENLGIRVSPTSNTLEDNNNQAITFLPEKFQ